MIKPINTFPNDQLLRLAEECKPMEDSLDLEETPDVWPAELVELVQDLKDTLSAGTGIGLAANQIWDKPEAVPMVFVLKIGDDIVEVINPTLKTTGKPVDVTEGCLSRPGFFREVRRKQNVEITYQTLGSTEKYTTKFYYNVHKIIPIVLQHEMDHLLGKVI